MPQSRLIPNLRYGGTGFHAIGLDGTRQSSGVVSKDANLYFEDNLKDRLSYLRHTGIVLRTLYTGKDIPLSECIIQDERGDYLEW